MDGEPEILIVGEDAGMARLVGGLGLRPHVVDQHHEALAKLRRLSPALVIVNLPGIAIQPNFLTALSKGRHPILIVTDPGAPLGGVGIEHPRLRALERPVGDADLLAAIRSLLGISRDAGESQGAHKRPEPSERYFTDFAPLFLHSPKMRAVKEMIERVADTTATVLIRGESGVGKDIVARAIHYASPRHGQPLVKVNCATFPSDLLESELFGYERGAFTGAYERKPGRFELADRGTFCLDEIGELPVALQAKLLHVLQDHEFSRLGGRDMIRVDARVVASTNRNLETAMSTGQFREDLYYRLSVLEIQVPSLRERKEEIPILARSFLEKFNQRNVAKAKLPPETLRLFMEYPWPGNVRELENTILRLVVLGDSRQIHEEILARLRAVPPKPPEPGEAEVVPGPPPAEKGSLGLREIARRAARDAERKAIREVLERVRWNRSEAARLLQVSYKTLLSKINELGLAPKERLPRSQSVPIGEIVPDGETLLSSELPWEG